MQILNDLKSQYRTGGVTERAIYWNCAVFLLSLFFYKFREGVFDFPDWLVLSSAVSELWFRPWTLVTYSFFHSGFWHLLLNMMVLNFVGRFFVTFFNPKQFVGVYLLGALGSGLFFLMGFSLLHLGQGSQLVGASGAIMAVLLATTTYAPLMNLRLLLIGNVKMWQFTFVILVLDVIQLFVENTGGHLAHLGGALVGFCFVKLLQQGLDITRPVTAFLNLFQSPASYRRRTPFRKVHRNYPVKPEKRVSKIVAKDKVQQQIDEILDKIGKSGYDSLTQEEKEFLFRAGK